MATMSFLFFLQCIFILFFSCPSSPTKRVLMASLPSFTWSATQQRLPQRYCSQFACESCGMSCFFIIYIFIFFSDCASFFSCVPCCPCKCVFVLPFYQQQYLYESLTSCFFFFLLSFSEGRTDNVEGEKC